MADRPALVACVFYQDPIAAMKWLEKAFGFETTILLTDADGRVGHAEMEFRGVPVGPFLGRDAIASAYSVQPPDDELRLLEQREVGGVIQARYAWLAEPEVAAGEMYLTPEDGSIRKLVVTFDRGVTWS